MKWRTQDEREIEISDLTDSHLKNIISHSLKVAAVTRTTEALALDSASESMIFGEEAAFELGRASAELYSMTDEEYLEKNKPKFKEIFAEAKKRGIAISVINR